MTDNSTAYGSLILTKSVSSGLNRRMLLDRLATQCIALGGWLILFVILAIIVVILSEALPLFGSAKIKEPISQEFTLTHPAKLALTDEYQEQLLLIDEQFSLAHHNILDKETKHSKLLAVTDVENNQPANIDTNVVISATYQQEKDWYIATNLGDVYRFKINFNSNFIDQKRATSTNYALSEPLKLLDEQLELKGIAAANTSSGLLLAGHTNNQTVYLLTQKTTRTLLGTGPVVNIRSQINIPINGKISAIALDIRGAVLFIGSSQGELIALSLKDLESPVFSQSIKLVDAITSLQFALGGRTLLAGQANGQLSSWQTFSTKDSIEIQNINKFTGHSAAITHIAPSLRSKTFLVVDANDRVALHYTTTGRNLASYDLKLSNNEHIVAASLAPKADAIIAATSNGTLLNFPIYNPHPEISWQALFGKVRYEGYREAAHVWQSTGGTDNSEPKLGLMPLIFGTLKGAFYALLFALPLAIAAAIFTSLFMSPRMKSFIKPIMEMMAALPSVVIGFIAGLWLAPILEPHLLIVVVMPLVAIATLVFTCLSCWLSRKIFHLNSKLGSELYYAIPTIVIAAILSFYFSNTIEQLFFAGNLKVWLYDNLNINVDQRNSIIAGIAVGFAVIPIIFTIAEDCISSVPRTLTAAGLALGATRWQTALKVVVPVAAPGIFAAVMIGIGRAVGETMIVLMATGNTPLMDPSVFTGFRALSANIAVELPEAPHGSTLYRILFLTAFILFLMTFILNALSELVRMRLRKKLGAAH